MSGTTSVPQIQFTPTGLVLPTEADILTGVQADMDAAFGGALNPALETPQGQLASSQTAVIGDVNALFAEFVNQIDPDYSDGFMQDAIARLYFLQRIAGEPTTVDCTCVGAASTVIPIGAQAQDTSGNKYTCTSGGIIPIGGSITLAFANVVNGPIACAANTLTIIYQQIPGWDSINNPAGGVEGINTETRAEFEYRRFNSVAINAHGSPEAIYANVFAVPGVLDVYVYDNVLNTSFSLGSTGYSVAAHSVYVAVVGGVNAEVAQAIWERKDLGCNYNGNTTVVVTDPSGYFTPLPTYSVTFERPAALPILFAVQITNSASLPGDVVTRVKNAIVAAFNGGDGGPRARTGATLLASRYYAPVTAALPDASILSILIGTSTATLYALTVGVDKHPTISASDIAVTLV